MTPSPHSQKMYAVFWGEDEVGFCDDGGLEILWKGGTHFRPILFKSKEEARGYIDRTNEWRYSKGFDPIKFKIKEASRNA